MKQKGVTLIEMLLIIALFASVFAMLIIVAPQQTDETRRTKTTLQMQQILNAGLAYYIVNGKWPSVLADLQNNGFLPPTAVSLQNSWGGKYGITAQAQNKLYAYTSVVNNANAQLIAGKLPGSFVADQAGATATPTPNQGGCPGGTGCTYVVASVEIPGQNLSNATSATFSSVYHSGACIPAPLCPVDKNGKQLVQEILVIPVSVSGVYSDPSGSCSNPYDYSKCNQINVLPISSYTARAIGDANGNPVKYPSSLIQSCDNSGPAPCYATAPSNPADPTSVTEVPPGQYWRACLYVTTEQGTITPVTTTWVQGQAMGTVLAVTRCSVPSENLGASFTVWQK